MCTTFQVTKHSSTLQRGCNLRKSKQPQRNIYLKQYVSA